MIATSRKQCFPVPSLLDLVYLQELVDCAKSCYDRGWSHGTAGNFSVRGYNGVIWQSPSGLNKGALNCRDFIPIDLESTQVIWPLASVRPSQEMPVHLGIYRAQDQAKAVVHTHPPHLVRLSRQGQDIAFKGDEMAKHLGASDHLQLVQIPVVQNPLPSEMPQMTEGIGAFLRSGLNVVVLAAHGVYAWGRTPMEALSYIEALEFLCQTQN